MARSRWVGTMVALLQRCKQAKNECANAALSSPARCTDAVLRREILFRKVLPQNNNNNLNGEIFFFEETQKIGSYFGPFRDAHLRLVPLSCVNLPCSFSELGESVNFSGTRRHHNIIIGSLFRVVVFGWRAIRGNNLASPSPNSLL